MFYNVLLYFLIINGLTLLLFALDKFYARRGSWRISESTLLGLCLLGGSPAAILGQIMLRHKTSKLSFQRRFRMIVWIQIAGLIWWIYVHAT